MSNIITPPEIKILSPLSLVAMKSIYGEPNAIHKPASGARRITWHRNGESITLVDKLRIEVVANDRPEEEEVNNV